MAKLSRYHMLNVSIVVDSIAGEDFGSEFAYRITMPSDLATLTKGVDKVSTSIAFDPSATLELSYKATSPTNDQLMTLWHNQQTSVGSTFDIAITSGVNEGFFLKNCAISKAPDLEGGGAVMVMREWTLTSEQFVPDQSLLS